MRHIFSVNVAKKYGMDCAVMLENLYFWISKNKANDKHYHDGKYWTYNSVKAFEELFPYWTYNQVRRILKKLEDEELIEKGNFNQSTYDRTAWYTLTTNAFAFFDSSMCVKPQMEDDKSTNRNGENNKPIPDVNTDDKPDGKPITPNPQAGADDDSKKSPAKKSDYSEKFEQWWALYPRKTGKGAAWKKWKSEKLEKRFDELLEKLKQQNAMQHAFMNPQYIVGASRYLNEARYDDEVVFLGGKGNGVSAGMTAIEQRNREVAERFLQENGGENEF